MGQSSSSSSPYSNAPQLQNALVNGTWPSLLLNSTHVVHLDNDAYANPFQHKYIVKLNSKIPPFCNMTIIFPNHPVEKKRLLWVQTYSLNGLSVEINKRLGESSRDGLSMAVTMGNKIIRFKGFVGNLYLVWAERVSQETINRQENRIGENVPILIETNGQMRYRNVFIFDEGQMTQPTPIKDIQWFDPFHSELFCCEADIRQFQPRLVATVSNDYADQVTRDPVVRSIINLDNEPPPFSQDENDLHLQVDSGRSLNYDSDPKKPDEIGG